MASHDHSRPSRRSKSADAFRTISEVSDDVGVPQHVLRFWETKFSQIKPLKRGGGRRYYRPEDINLLHRIRAWLYDDGYTIKGVQKLLKEGGVPVATDGLRSGSGSDSEADTGGDRDLATDEEAARNERVSEADPQVLRPRDLDDDDEAAAASMEQQKPVKQERTAEHVLGIDEIDVAQVEGGQVEDVRVEDGRAETDSVDDGRIDVPDIDIAQIDVQDDPFQVPVRAERVAVERADPTRVSVDDLTEDVLLNEGPPPKFDDWDRGSLDNVIESLEEIRDRLRGPPPEP